MDLTLIEQSRSVTLIQEHFLCGFRTVQMGDKDYYKTLGLERNASRADIKRAYRTLAKQFHPDTNPQPDAAKRFSEIKEAHDVLIDAKSRREYDRQISSKSDSSRNGKSPIDQDLDKQVMQGIHGIPPTEYAKGWTPRQDRRPYRRAEYEGAEMTICWTVICLSIAFAAAWFFISIYSEDPIVPSSDDAPYGDSRRNTEELLAESNSTLVNSRIIDLMNYYSRDTRETAANALGNLGDKRAVSPLIYILSSERCPYVRQAVATSLGQLGEKRAVDPLIKALGDDSWWVRQAVATSLGQLGDKRAVDPLIKALSDRYGGVRIAGEEALTKLGYKK